MVHMCALVIDNGLAIGDTALRKAFDLLNRTKSFLLESMAMLTAVDAVALHTCQSASRMSNSRPNYHTKLTS